MNPAVLIAALAAVIIWSAGPIATKIAVAELPVLAVAAGRTCFGGAIVLPLALALRIPFPRQSPQIVLLVLSAISGFAAFPLVVSFGMMMTSGTHGVMILAFLPVMTGLIANIWDRVFPSYAWWFGSALALIGEALLLRVDPVTSGASDIRGDALVFVSTFFLAFGYVAGGRLTRTGYSSQATTYWGVALASLIMTPLLPYFFGVADVSAVSWEAWASVAYLAFGVTVAGYVLWYWALARGGIAKVSLIQFFQPVSGLIVARMLLDDPLSSELLLAATLVIGGVVIASRKPVQP